jgi:hypothetical protein
MRYKLECLNRKRPSLTFLKYSLHLFRESAALAESNAIIP